MGGDDADGVLAQIAQGLDQAGDLHDGQFKNGPHRAPHRAPQERAAARLPDDQRLRAERRAIADQRPEILGAGEAIGRRQESRLRAACHHFRQRWHYWNLPHRKQALVHREASERFQQCLFGNEHPDLLRPRLQQRPQLRQPFLGEKDRDNAELALQQAAHDLLALRDENALLPVLVLPPHRAVRLKLGQIERLNLLQAIHATRG